MSTPHTDKLYKVVQNIAGDVPTSMTRILPHIAEIERLLASNELRSPNALPQLLYKFAKALDSSIS